MLIPYLIENGGAWILRQQAQHRTAGVRLGAESQRLLAPFFEPVILDTTRVCVISRIENPPFYADLERAGITMPLDFRQMAGITFVDTVLVSAGASDPNSLESLLFHECVHVDQYRHLGVDRFIREYVEGWAGHGFDYFSIPLEKHAYELQTRFSSAPEHKFSVEQSVRDRFP